ncbi:hypothetical protein GCM10023235_40430 [Kitasatospora terrestris]|uniref:Uncharacterized protein n=1 Tax=Kitasatospora terrestris TaxID=258051 RepID=A0ABP9DUD7_9ACTN
MRAGRVAGGEERTTGLWAGRDPATAPVNHAPDARFDGAVLPDAATLLAALALERAAQTSSGPVKSGGV